MVAAFSAKHGVKFREVVGVVLLPGYWSAVTRGVSDGSMQCPSSQRTQAMFEWSVGSVVVAPGIVTDAAVVVCCGVVSGPIARHVASGTVSV
jgi:hypothetical protein